MVETDQTSTQMTRQQIDYKSNIHWQLNRIMQISSAAPSQFAADADIAYTLCMSITALEALISPYADQAYKDSEGGKLEFKGSATQMKTQAMNKLSSLMHLLARKGMLLEISVVEDV